MADGGHDHERAAVQHVEHPSCECVSPALVESRCNHVAPSRRVRSLRIPCSPAHDAARRTPTARSSATRAGPRSPARAAGRGAAPRLGPLRRSRGVHVSLREARPRGRPRIPDPVLRARPRRARSVIGGKVEKFVGDAVMGVFGAPVTYGDDAERAVRAAFAVRDWAEHDGLQLRVAVNTGEAIVALERQPRPRRDVRRGGRCEHRCPSAVRVARRGRARRRGDVRGHARVDRVPARPACRGEGKGGSGSGLARPSAHLRHRGAAGDARPDDRPRPRARRAHRHLGSRRRRGEEPLRRPCSGRRASGSRASRSNSRSSWPDRARV